MKEILASSGDFSEERIDLDSLRSRLEELTEMQSKFYDSSLDVASGNMENLLEECIEDFQDKLKHLDAEDKLIVSLGSEELEAFKEDLRKEICLLEEENLNITQEIDTLTKKVFEGDLVQLTGSIEASACSLKLVQLEGIRDSSYPDSMPVADSCSNGLECFNCCKFEVLDIGQQIEETKMTLSTLHDLDNALKRVDVIGQFEHILSEVRVIEFQGNFIRLSLRTPIPALDDLHFRQRFDSQVEPSVSEHELSIEVIEKTMELKNAEIFPSDVSLHGLIDYAKLSRGSVYSPVQSLEWFVRKVEHRILLCMLRRSLVKDANNLRHTFEYSDRDNVITAHLIGGVDIFIKLNQDWPISNPPLHLLSVKASGQPSTSISLSFIWKVKEMANSLDTHTRSHLSRFVDAIEQILGHEMQTEIQSTNGAAV